jgi:hypothetical protein
VCGCSARQRPHEGGCMSTKIYKGIPQCALLSLSLAPECWWPP